MRFVSYCCLLIIGNTVSQVYAQDVEPLPTPASSLPPVVKTVQENVSSAPAITPVESASIEGFDSAFENALNQFAPKDRTAKLIVGRNQAEDIFGTANPPEIVSTPDQPEFLDPREFPNSIPSEDNPGGVRTPTGEGDFGGTSESDFTDPAPETTPEPVAPRKEYIPPPAGMIPMGIDFTQRSGSGGGSASTGASQLAPTNQSVVDNGVQPIEITQEPVLVSDQPGQLTQLPLPISEPINIAPVPADMTTLPDQTPHSPFIERSPQLPLAKSPQPSSDWYVPEGNGSALEPSLETGIGSSNYSTNSFATENTSQQLSAPGWSDIVVDPMTWWKSEVIQSLDGSRPIDAVDSNTLVYMALRNSPRIQAVSQNPLIRELQIVEADSEFDAVRYLRSQFEDRVDPVGNQLTVGNGESFLKDNIWSADAGFRKKARNGANWELNQQLGFQNSNSNFFVPQDQGTATLALNVTQPLLRGRGRYYNESQILIAQATNGAAWRTFQAELQDELLGVMSAYWDLYLTRSIFLQKQRNVERGAKILDRLEGRKELDSLPSQIARARSSVQTRRTELANALRDVLNAETEVRRRIADTSWINSGGTELIPGELPYAATFNVPLEQVVYNALQHRPEVHEALNRVRVASVQRDVSANELLPELSLLMGTYVSALRGDTGILNAFQDQFGQVKPGYSFGINFELPYGNRAARSRLAQRQLQVRKIRAEVEEVMQSVIAESQVALRRVQSASETLVAATEAIRAARSDREQFERRWESFALVEGDLADGQNPTTVLDQLLDSQDRLASAELVYVQAERELKVAEVSLQRAMGTLLMAQNVTATRGFDQDIPRMDIIKSDASMPGMVSEIPVEVPQVQQYQEVAPTGYTQTPW